MHRLFLTIVVVFGVMLVPGLARADELNSYGAVVCKGNRALIRFTFAENSDRPVFTRSDSPQPDPTGPALLSSKPIDKELDQLVPDDPSRCRLQNGTEVVLRQADLGDGKAYGMCGGDTSEIFSVWVGNKKIYNREIWHPKCGYPYEITEILLDRDRLTECRVPKDGLASDPQPATCVDQSPRLTRPILDAGDPGKVKLPHFAPGKETFCRSLIGPLPADDPRLNSFWPTRLSEGIEEVRADGEINELEKPLSIDLDNDGKLDRAISWSGDLGGPNGDESLWAMLPETASDDAVGALQEKLTNAGESTVKALRTSGIKVFAGDQTAYGSVGYVHLSPFVRDHTTWMHARRVRGAGNVEQPTDIILRPTPDGSLHEICVFYANPPA